MIGGDNVRAKIINGMEKKKQRKKGGGLLYGSIKSLDYSVYLVSGTGTYVICVTTGMCDNSLNSWYYTLLHEVLIYSKCDEFL